jgi:hypothetical protein
VITAVDTNILLDVLLPDPDHEVSSDRLLAGASRMGATVTTEPVYAELAARFPEHDDLSRFLGATSVRLEATRPDALRLAGQAWQVYNRRRPLPLSCPRCGAVQGVPCTACGAGHPAQATHRRGLHQRRTRQPARRSPTHQGRRILQDLLFAFGPGITFRERLQRDFSRGQWRSMSRNRTRSGFQVRREPGKGSRPGVAGGAGDVA